MVAKGESASCTKAYCVKCKKQQDMKECENVQAKNGRWMTKGKCSVCECKMNKFISKPDA